MEKKPKRRKIIFIALGSVAILMIFCLVILLWLGSSADESIGDPSTSSGEPSPILEKPPTISAQENLNPIPSDELPYQSVVQIIVQGEIEGSLEEWTGSGTIISPDGLILTNAHVALGDHFYPAEQLVIALTIAQDKLPQSMFIAEVVQADPALDLAVLQITTNLSGIPFDKENTSLPHVSIGNSDLLNLGDSISILGYPGIGGETITLTSGDVSGFTSEDPYGDRAFIKTSATIAGGNSGGLAIDSNNQLIGIPTQVGSGGYYDETVDCRALADTNRDGYIDEEDTCVPTGGFINALRPINLAKPLIEAAINNEGTYTAATLIEKDPISTGNTIILEDDFSDDSEGWPVVQDSSSANFYKNGRYYLEVKEAEYLSQVYFESKASDVILEIDVRVETSSEDGEYGFFCRYEEGRYGYFFEFSEDGYFAIYKYIDEEWFPLVNYTSEEKLENMKSGRIKASCIGDTLSLGIDNQTLATVKDNSFDNGVFGIFVWTFKNSNNIVSFDNLTFSQPNL